MAFTKDKYQADLYNALKNIKSPNKYVKREFPKIKKEDIERGWINRYFFRQTNNINAQIIETNESQYNSFINNPFYQNIKIRWKITGDRLKIAEVNLKELTDADKKFKGLKKEFENKLLKYESNDF